MDIKQRNYQPTLTALMPTGIGFNSNSGDIQEILKRTAYYLNQTDRRLRIVWTEGNPYQTLQLLPEWEASFGLPNECYVKGTQTLDERRQAVINKWEDLGGDRIARYITIAKNLGYQNASITRFRYHTCELNCEQPINEKEWRFVWMLNTQEATKIKEATCQSGVEDPLRVWGDNILECVIMKEAASYVLVLFSYIGEGL